MKFANEVFLNLPQSYKWHAKVLRKFCVQSKEERSGTGAEGRSDWKGINEVFCK